MASGQPWQGTPGHLVCCSGTYPAHLKSSEDSWLFMDRATAVRAAVSRGT